MSARHFDMEQALANPKRIFGTPERVLEEPGLDDHAKLAILKSWEQDARELGVAAEEGMSGGEQDMLQRIHNALNALPVKDGHESPAANKQGGSSAE